MPHVVLYGPQAKKPEDDPKTRELIRWLQSSDRPDKSLSRLIREEFIAYAQWRERVVVELKRASDALQAGRHSDAMELPFRATEQYTAGYHMGRYEAFKRGSELLADVINRAGLDEELGVDDTADAVADDAVAYWSATDERTRDLSHHRGIGRWEDDAAWLAIGQAHRDMLLDLGPLKGATVLEWGPGGGSNVLALLEAGASLVCGVDISQSNLDACKHEASKVSGEFTPVLIDARSPVTPCRDGSVDVVLSTACFQHFPSREFGEAVLQEMYRVLRPGGFGLIQIRTNDDGDFPQQHKDYEANAISFTTWRSVDFGVELKRAGFMSWTKAVRPGAGVGYVYFGVRK